jgi:hypothetical protein
MAQHSIYIRKIFPSMLVVSLFAFSAPVEADIYKCESAKGKTVYSDMPCHSNSTQTITDIQPDVVAQPQSPDKQKPVVMRQLDDAVKSAIARGDLTRADALAVTSEQREWIAIAKKDSRKQDSRTEAKLAADKTESGECQQAKLNLEKEADSSFNKPDVLKAKTSLMRAACGLNDDGDHDQTYVNQNVPFLFDTHQRYSNRNLDRWPNKPRPPNSQSGTSPPYDRYMEKPFGSSYIRPDDRPAR